VSNLEEHQENLGAFCAFMVDLFTEEGVQEIAQNLRALGKNELAQEYERLAKAMLSWLERVEA